MPGGWRRAGSTQEENEKTGSAGRVARKVAGGSARLRLTAAGTDDVARAVRARHAAGTSALQVATSDAVARRRRAVAERGHAVADVLALEPAGDAEVGVALTGALAGDVAIVAARDLALGALRADDVTSVWLGAGDVAGGLVRARTLGAVTVLIPVTNYRGERCREAHRKEDHRANERASSSRAGNDHSATTPHRRACRRCLGAVARWVTGG